MKARPTSGKRLTWSALMTPVSLVVLLVVWEVAIARLSIPSYLLPAPSSILKALWHGVTAPIATPRSLLYHMGITLKATLIGFVAGSAVGVCLGMLLSENSLLERLLMPYVFGLQSLPKVAIAPLILIWFGFGLTSKAVLAGLLTFFPLLINTLVAMRSVDQDYLRLLRSLKATRWQVLWRLKVPTALPMILAGLDMATVQSLLGAVVAEFISGQAGIGVAIVQYQYINDTAGVFSALVILAVTGVILHALVQFAERRLLFWKPRAQQGGAANAHVSTSA